MSQWFRFTPSDSLFFRSGEPMELGENHSTGHLLLPPPSVILGALRTTWLRINGIPIDEFRKNPSATTQKAVGLWGQPSPFFATGPLLLKGEEITANNLFLPAPYSWFTTRPEKGASPQNALPLIRAKPDLPPWVRLPHGASTLWARHGEQVESLGGSWISLDQLLKPSPTVRIAHLSDFCQEEDHTGIALHPWRTVREGRIYRFRHIRLNLQCSLVFGITYEQEGGLLDLPEKFPLPLGAERRFGLCHRINPPPLPQAKQAHQWMALNPLPSSPETNASLLAGGRIRYLGGWDLARQFHKPMLGYFPPGSTFNSAQKSCIPLEDPQ